MPIQRVRSSGEPLQNDTPHFQKSTQSTRVAIHHRVGENHRLSSRNVLMLHPCIARLTVCFLACLGLCCEANALAPQDNQPQPKAVRVKTAKELGIKFDQYQTVDSLGRKITFYLTPTDPEAPPKPLMIWTAGSGCTSLFFKPTEDFKKKHGIPLELDIVIGKMQDFVHDIARNRVHILCVEKVGVSFLDAPDTYGTAEGATEEYLREHTLDRWGIAIDAACNSISHLPGIDRSRLLLAGHSEGANTSAHLATRMTEATHVGFLAGSGGSQLFGLPQLARLGHLDGKNEKSVTPPVPNEVAYEKALQQFQNVLNDPENTQDLLWGHPYRYWASFGTQSPLDDLKQTKAKVFLAYGTQDHATPVAGNDSLRAGLLAHQKDLTVKRIVGGDHGLTVAETSTDHLPEVLDAMIVWFLEDGKKDTP